MCWPNLYCSCIVSSVSARIFDCLLDFSTYICLIGVINLTCLKHHAWSSFPLNLLCTSTPSPLTCPSSQPFKLNSLQAKLRWNSCPTPVYIQLSGKLLMFPSVSGLHLQFCLTGASAWSAWITVAFPTQLMSLLQALDFLQSSLKMCFIKLVRSHLSPALNLAMDFPFML